LPRGALGETLTALGLLLEDLLWRRLILEEHARNVGMSENSVLRRITGHNKDEVTRQCTKLHDEKIHNLKVYSYCAL
jgi:hypothetical protein